jgi:hypothetical protein
VAAATDAAVAHARQVVAQQVLLRAAGRKAWRRVDPNRISESWAESLTSFMPVVYASQYQAAMLGASYSAGVLAEQDLWVPPSGWVDPSAFVGTAPDGRSLEGLLQSPVIHAKTAIGSGVKAEAAVRNAQNFLAQILIGMVADVSRQAASVDIAARTGVGYVRVASGESCGRCIPLLGKFYRWNTGFLRHPKDDCIHQPTTASAAQAHANDAYDAFNAMSRADQDREFTPGGAQAIRDGADLYQVANSMRRRTKSGMFTLEGTSRRGNAGRLLAPGQRRMTPDAIYKTARSREEALQALRDQGYILPGGQVPGGSLRGMVEGFGQMGRGGTRRAASQAVLDARATGVRDPASRYTMTAAERRLADAERDYRMVLQGRNPWASRGFGQTPDPYGEGLNTVGGDSGAPLTPQIAAAVEDNYRRWLATGGQIYK